MPSRAWLPWAASIPAMPLVGYLLWIVALPEYRESYGFAVVLTASVVLGIVVFAFIAFGLYDDERK